MMNKLPEYAADVLRETYKAKKPAPIAGIKIYRCPSGGPKHTEGGCTGRIVLESDPRCLVCKVDWTSPRTDGLAVMWEDYAL